MHTKSKIKIKLAKSLTTFKSLYSKVADPKSQNSKLKLPKSHPNETPKTHLRKCYNKVNKTGQNITKNYNENSQIGVE